jgi:hypothetical protein
MYYGGGSKPPTRQRRSKHASRVSNTGKSLSEDEVQLRDLSEEHWSFNSRVEGGSTDVDYRPTAGLHGVDVRREYGVQVDSINEPGPRSAGRYS